MRFFSRWIVVSSGRIRDRIGQAEFRERLMEGTASRLEIWYGIRRGQMSDAAMSIVVK